jgi:hypothetical protein
MNRVNWRSVLAALSLMLLGAAVGIAADRLLHGRQPRLAALHAQALHDPLAVLDEEFDLRPDQRTRIAAILESRQSIMDTTWHATRTRLHATVDSLVNEIAAVLDPEDEGRFRQFAAEAHRDPAALHGRYMH